MKKILLIAAAMLAFAGCKEVDPVEPPVPQEPDEISVSPKSGIVGGEGGKVTTTVTSNGEWTLATAGGATYDWVDALPLSGKAGKTVVTFEVDENTDRGDVEAKFVFTCGDATAEFTVKSTQKEVVIPEIEVTSDNPVKLGNEGGVFDVTLATDTEGAELVAADFEAETSADWLTFNAPATGDATSATLNFTAEANSEEGAPARSADITISYPGVENIVIKVNQAAGPEPQVPEYEIELVTETPLEVEYTEGTAPITVSISDGVTAANLTAESDQPWVNLQSAVANGIGKAMMIFSYTANTTAVARTANITVQYEGVDYFTFQLVQAGDPNAGGEQPGDYYITKAPVFNFHCASYAHTNPADTPWNNPDVMNFGNVITAEVLVCHDETFDDGTHSSGKWEGRNIGSILGIEGEFLIRHGDTPNTRLQQWELVLNGLNVRSSTDLQGGVWTHLAVVLDGTNATIYQDGQNVGSAALPADFAGVDLTNYYNGWRQVQFFSIGRSVDNTRSFCGKMAEVRLWNRALSADEINAENHFYTVDPDSEGLVAYWKLNEGEGTVFHDSTSNGNDLTGYAVDGSVWGNYMGLDKWTVGVEWADVEAGPMN